MSLSTQDVERVRRAVLAGGGGWIGIQEAIDDNPEVVFIKNHTICKLGLDLANFSDSQFCIAVRDAKKNVHI